MSPILVQSSSLQSLTSSSPPSFILSPPLLFPFLSPFPPSLPPPPPSSHISHLPSSPPLTILFSSSAWCDGDESNDEGLTQQLRHTPNIERYNIIEPPCEGRGRGRRGSEGGSERETGSQKQRGEGEGMWRGLTNKTCLNLGCLQPEMSVPRGERKR